MNNETNTNAAAAAAETAEFVIVDSSVTLVNYSIGKVHFYKTRQIKHYGIRGLRPECGKSMRNRNGGAYEMNGVVEVPAFTVCEKCLQIAINNGTAKVITREVTEADMFR